MKIFNIAIVDDDAASATSLKGEITSYMDRNGYPVSVEVFLKPLSFLDSFRCDYDIIFLDIEMPTLDGITLARKIREKDELVPLLFVTNLSQFALEAYSVHAVDYILKPVSDKAFELKMSRLMQKLAPEANERFIIKTSGSTMVVPVTSIDYIEANDHHVIYHVGENVYTTYERIKDVEKRLPHFFTKCNRYYIVNILKVSSIQGDFVVLTKGKAELKISRSEKKSFLERVSQYFSGTPGVADR